VRSQFLVDRIGTGALLCCRSQHDLSIQQIQPQQFLRRLSILPLKDFAHQTWVCSDARALPPRSYGRSGRTDQRENSPRNSSQSLLEADGLSLQMVNDDHTATEDRVESPRAVDDFLDNWWSQATPDW